MQETKTNLKRRITTITLAAITLAAAIGSLHHDNHKFIQGSLKKVRAEVSEIKLLAQDCEADRKEIRSDLVDLTKKVARQEGFIEGQKTVTTSGKGKLNISKN